jgi:hypothetical protein
MPILPVVRKGSCPSETKQDDIIALSSTGDVAANGVEDRLTDLAGLGRGGGKSLLQTFAAEQSAFAVQRLVHAIGIKQ